MKNLVIVTVVAGTMIASASSYATGFGSRGIALDAAESAYGNDPVVSKVKTIRFNQQTGTAEYHVAVGIGNAEDGQHNYDVQIFGKNKPVVVEIRNF